MPVNIRKDDVAKRIAINILGPPPSGLVDSFGKKKKFIKKKDKDQGKINRFEEIGYR